MTTYARDGGCASSFECFVSLFKEPIQALTDWVSMSRLVASFKSPTLAAVVLMVSLFAGFAAIVAVGVLVVEWRRDVERTKRTMARFKAMEAIHKARQQQAGTRGRQQ